MLANLKVIGHPLWRNLPALKVIDKGVIDAEMERREQMMRANLESIGHLFLRNLLAVTVIGKVVQAPAPSAPRSRKQQQLHLLHLLPRSRRPRRLHPPRNEFEGLPTTLTATAEERHPSAWTTHGPC